MKVLDSVKALYDKSGEMIIVTDMRLKVLWKSDASLPDFISRSDFLQEFGKTPELPIRSSAILHYVDGRSVKIQPLYDNDTPKGYMLTFFDADEIETLSDRSSLLKYKRNALGNIRLAVSPIIAQLDRLKQESSSGDLNDLYDTIHSSVLKMLSSTVNSNELTKYYSGEFTHELLNVSQCLEVTAQLFNKRFRSTDCEFTTDIESAVFMNMNYERLSLAVINLLINGYMYCNNEQKKLALRLYRKDNKVIIDVFDNGQDADVEALNEATTPFKAFAKFKSGEMLGLAIVSKFAEHFNGSLSFIKSDDGLTVRLEFSDKICDEPTSFKLKRATPFVGDFEPANCILAKGLDIDKNTK